MDIVNNPIGCISKLLTEYDTETVQQTLQICQSAVRHIKELDDTLDKLNYAILAKKYDDAMKFATNCRQQLNKYTKDRYFLDTLNSKYLGILDLIKQSLLNEFQVSQEDTVINEQLSRAGQLLDLLNEQEQIKFLQLLCQKICSVMPKYPFHQFYEEYIKWIFEILKDDSKYRILDRWNFNRYIIDAWADKLRDAIFEEDIANLNMKIYQLLRKIEKQLEPYHSNPIDLVCIAFDPFCNNQINLIISNFNKTTQNFQKMDSITSSLVARVYESFVNIFKQLNDIDTLCKKNMLMNERNAHILLKFYEASINNFIKSFNQILFNDQLFISNLDNLVNLKHSLEYLTNSCASMLKHFSMYTSYTMTFIAETVIKQINNKIFNYYKSVTAENLNRSVLRYREDIFSTIKKTVIPSTISDHSLQDDISDHIRLIGTILQKISIYDTNIKSYLLTDIDQFYKNLIDPTNLANSSIKPQLFQQIIMDLYHIKQSAKDSSGIFTELENKVKFLNGDILNEKIFVEQFKTFYVRHNVDTLKIIMKFKNIDKTKYANIVNIYLNL